MAAATRDMGPVAEILWLVSASLDLAVRYEQGWAAIIWSGSMQRESSLRSGSTTSAATWLELSSGPEPAWPGLITIIVGDEWQREIATWVVESFGDHLRDRVSVWCVADGARTGAVGLWIAGGGFGNTPTPGHGRLVLGSSDGFLTVVQVRLGCRWPGYLFPLAQGGQRAHRRRPRVFGPAEGRSGGDDSAGLG